MVLTQEDKQAIVDLCGWKGNAQKGVLFLQMMYSGDTTDDEALKAVQDVMYTQECRSLLLTWSKYIFLMQIARFILEKIDQEGFTDRFYEWSKSHA
jgi:hypothetical protein